MLNLFESLTEQELSLLDDMLLNRNDDDEVAQGQDEGVLCISELDGFLTAIVSGPIVLPPSRWIPALWGDIEPAWEDAKEFETFMSLVMRHSNSIVDLLMDDSAAFELMCEEREVEGKVIRLVDEWCEGYLRGVRLCAQEWRGGGVEMDSLLTPIRAFTAESDWSAFALADKSEVEALRESIAPNVRAIHARWFAARSTERLPFRRAGPSVGRNDPCPCGSGKKFKRCCLH